MGEIPSPPPAGKRPSIFEAAKNKVGGAVRKAKEALGVVPRPEPTLEELEQQAQQVEGELAAVTLKEDVKALQTNVQLNKITDILERSALGSGVEESQILALMEEMKTNNPTTPTNQSKDEVGQVVDMMERVRRGELTTAEALALIEKREKKTK